MSSNRLIPEPELSMKPVTWRQWIAHSMQLRNINIDKTDVIITMSKPWIPSSQNHIWFKCVHDACFVLFLSATDTQPTAGHNRFIISFWWIFCVVVTATYTSNLIAFLTVDKHETPFNTLDEMMNQDLYKFGTFGETSWQDIFEVSVFPDLGLCNCPTLILTWCFPKQQSWKSGSRENRSKGYQGPKRFFASRCSLWQNPRKGLLS